MSRCVLMLSYLFPPRGGAGVQRALKFAKYLPQFGWRPLVIAHGGVARDRVTTKQDATLLRDLPSEAVVHYTTLTPSEQRVSGRMQSRWRQRFCVTDPMGWWAEPACRAATDALRQHDVRAILVTMSPFTAAAAGIRLKRHWGLPLILDLRDPWALDETRIYPSRWHAWRDWTAMAQTLRQADLVIMNTPEAARAAMKRLGLTRRTRVTWLTNGFDAEDFAPDAVQSDVEAAPADVLRIVHTGTFHGDQARVWDDLHAGRGWASRVKYARRPINLWTRTARYLLEAMERLVSRGLIPRGKLQLVLVGEMMPEDREMVRKSTVGDLVRLLDYQSHEASLGWVRSADVLFLPLHTPLDGGPALVVPGKTYEYLGSGRPVLAMGPPGDMRRFVQETQSGFAIAGDDIDGAALILLKLYEAKRAGRVLASPDRAALARFERRYLAGRLAEELNETLRRGVSTAAMMAASNPPSALGTEH